MENYIIQKNLERIIRFKYPVSLLNDQAIDGNVSLKELIIISALIRHKKPKNLVEIGTFDGNTTLHMALNAPKGAIVHTLDLPADAAQTVHPLSEGDIKYIHCPQKQEKKYYNTKVQQKIREHLGDSGNFNFKTFIENRPLDFAFIDGSHSYESVASDTKNTLEILGENGMILWHDFTPQWPGVYRYLSELDLQLPLVHIEGTTLVMYTHQLPNPPVKVAKQIP